MHTLTQKRTHFRRTTASQRKLLFQTWQATGDVQLACRKAHVSERTYYNWKPRFEKAGYQGLEQFASHAPKKPRRTPQTVQQKVIHLRRTHPKWGKRRIADEMAKANNWVPLVSPNTVRRILIDAGLWSQIATQSVAKKPVQARTADKPEQSVNIDLCFIPATHETHEVVSKLPAVSGSSGRLVRKLRTWMLHDIRRESWS